MDRNSYLPYEWQDDARMRVLMGTMPPPNDTVAILARHTFWSASIHQWCRAIKRPIFTTQECEAAFRRGTQTPRCLPDILQHMYRQGELLPLSVVTQTCDRRGCETWGSWGVRVFVRSPARYALSLVKQAVGWGGLSDGMIVDTVVLKEMCDELLTTIHQHHLKSADPSSAQLFTLPQLYSLVCASGGFADTLRLMVDTLVCQGRATVREHKGTMFIKFIMPGDLSVPQITDMEVGECELIRVQSDVEIQVRKMTEEVGQLKQQAKAALQVGSRIEALSLLRRKKRLEKSLTVLLGALENISSCLQQLQQSRINRQVLGAFRAGVEALKVAVGGDLSPENAANTLDELNQVLEECDDVASLVSEGVRGQGEGEDADLEAELDSLLGADHKQTTLQETKLPDVPTSNPFSSVTPPRHNLSPSGRYGLPNLDMTPESL